MTRLKIPGTIIRHDKERGPQRPKKIFQKYLTKQNLYRILILMLLEAFIEKVQIFKKNFKKYLTR